MSLPFAVFGLTPVNGAQRRVLESNSYTFTSLAKLLTPNVELYKVVEVLKTVMLSPN